MHNAPADKPFRLFIFIWTGQFLSAIGSGMTAFALSIYAYQQTHTATGVSLIMLCYFTPALLLMPLGGALADRFDRRMLMIAGDGGAGVVVLGLSMLMMSQAPELWQVYLALALVSTFTAFHAPAYKAAVSDWVPESQYARASGLTQLSGAAQYLIAPVIAGALMSISDISHVLLLDALSFSLAIAALWISKRASGEPLATRAHDPIWPNLIDGMNYLITQKAILMLTVIVTAVCFFVGVLQTLFSPMLLAFTNPQTLSYALSLSASGMLVGSAAVGAINASRRLVNILMVGLTLMGVFYALLGCSMNLVAIIVVGFLFFTTLPFVNTAIEVLLRRNVDKSREGRVWSLVTMLSQVGYALSFASAGVLADRVFEPLLTLNGVLANSIGAWIGIGAGRGIALMFILSGLSVVMCATVLCGIRTTRQLEAVES